MEENHHLKLIYFMIYIIEMDVLDTHFQCINVI